MSLFTFAQSGHSYFNSRVQVEMDENFAELESEAAAVVAAGVSTSALSGPGAVPVTAAICEITTTGADALTLADGTEGQALAVVMVSDGGDGTLTPANPANFATLTFDNKDSASLLFTNGEWYYMGGNAAIA